MCSATAPSDHNAMALVLPLTDRAFSVFLVNSFRQVAATPKITVRKKRSASSHDKKRFVSSTAEERWCLRLCCYQFDIVTTAGQGRLDRPAQQAMEGEKPGTKSREILAPLVEPNKAYHISFSSAGKFTLEQPTKYNGLINHHDVLLKLSLEVGVKTSQVELELGLTQAQLASQIPSSNSSLNSSRAQKASSSLAHATENELARSSGAFRGPPLPALSASVVSLLPPTLPPSLALPQYAFPHAYAFANAEEPPDKWPSKHTRLSTRLVIGTITSSACKYVWLGRLQAHKNKLQASGIYEAVYAFLFDFGSIPHSWREVSKTHICCIFHLTRIRIKTKEDPII
ncbi:hypothetical protein M5K25_006155 [Dendrobium thyrsiflorum]|uniref:Uncharacterized protein n=1 Tax=Dendrobium thyrsiflorum TaxID=117978 RepID=A0ABD0VAP6_DENTH